MSARKASTKRELSRRTLLEIYAGMCLAREWELRFENLLRTGVLGKWYSAVGNEALGVATSAAMEGGDALLTLHRDSGAILARHVDVEALFPETFQAKADPVAEDASRNYLWRLACQMMGREPGFTAGFERSYHYGQISEKDGIVHVGMVSHLGAMMPVAAGVAFSQKERGEKTIAVNFIGDGGSSTGDFHEALNMAAVWKLPLVVIIENNGYAFSTPTEEQYAAKHLADRGRGYGISATRVDGDDPEAVYRAVRLARGRAIRGRGPTLIEAELGRFRGHAEEDGSLKLIPEDARDSLEMKDPVLGFEKRLLSLGHIDAAGVSALKERLAALLIEITDAARQAPEPEAEASVSGRSVFAPAVEIEETPRPRSHASEISYLESISRALREEMQEDHRVLLMGQDIARFGGAFRVTEGFLDQFGPSRVRNTPIAESGTLGIAIGAALRDFRPVVEMQFADFISSGFNQVVNVAAKMYYRWGGKVPLVIRCPFGGGVGAGPFHSQCPEAWFAHTPGLKIVAPAFPHDALGLLKAAIRDPNPVLFFEHKFLYRRIREAIPDDECLVPIGKARVVKEGHDVSLITYGWMVHRALAAAEALEQEDISVEVVDLRSLVPLDLDLIVESLARCNRALVVHEAPLTAGFGAEIAARIADAAFEYLDAPIKRLAYPDVPVPYNRELEAVCLPDERKIAEAVRGLVDY